MTMTSVLILFFACALGLIAYAVWRRSGATDEAEFADPQGFSESLYTPMLRILDASEFEFVRSQPGCTPQIERSFRRRRRLVFRQYLSALRRDFHVLDRLAHELILASEVDRSDLVRELARQRVLFYRRLLMLEGVLLLDRVGLSLTPAADVLKTCAEFKGLVAQLHSGPRALPMGA